MTTKTSILIVDDEKIVRESLADWFEKFGYVADSAASGLEALEKMDKFPFELLFVDIKMPGMDGIELLEKIKEIYPESTVIIMTAYGSIDTAVKAMKLGAGDYLLKPFKPDQLTLLMEKVDHQRRLASEYRYVKSRLEEITRFDNIIGQSAAMLEIYALIPEVAKTDSSILIVGETGTGKELVAKAIHAQSPRRHGPYIAINCGAIPDSLLESELFGYQKGAFTGAAQTRKGFLEVVHGGTLFLDEIGEISPKMQVDLLRVLEEKKITRLGDRQSINLDFRLISATTRNIEEEVKQGDFREDFFYRVNVITLHVPPLRKRKEDIPLLVDHFCKKYSHETKKQVDRVHREAIEFFKSYDWPGNVRELENAIERAVVLSKSRVLETRDFLFLKTSPPGYSRPLSLKEVEKEHILNILEESQWNITRASKILDINRVTLHRMIKRYGLKKKD